MRPGAWTRLRRAGGAVSFVAVFLQLLVTSCVGDSYATLDEGVGRTCVNDVDCPFYATCSLSECRYRCTDDADCLLISRARGGSYGCRENACWSGAAETEPPGSWSESAPVDAGTRCSPTGSLVRSDLPGASTGGLKSLVIDSTHVYVEVLDGSLAIHAAKLDGTGAFARIWDLTAGMPGTTRMTRSGDWLYFTEGSKLRRLPAPPVASAAPVDVVSAIGGEPQILGATRDRLFFSADAVFHRLDTTSNTLDSSGARLGSGFSRRHHVGACLLGEQAGNA